MFWMYCNEIAFLKRDACRAYFKAKLWKYQNIYRSKILENLPRNISIKMVQYQKTILTSRYISENSLIIETLQIYTKKHEKIHD